MVNTIWQGFPRFHVAFVIKRSLYIEFRVFRKKEKKKGLEVQKRPRFSGCRRLLGHDRGFPSRDKVVFFCRDKGPHGVTMMFCFMSQQRFLCRDRDDRGNRSRLQQELGQG